MKRYLILENGTVFEGEGFGADCPENGVISEIVFTTAMTGFLETLTDKSYFGQAVIQTFPLIGNYGVIPQDAESERVGCSAYIVREHCEKPSNFRAELTLDEFLKKNNIPGLFGIDTRALTKMLCTVGTMNGIITENPDKIDMEKIKAYRVTKAVETMTCKEKRELEKSSYPELKLGSEKPVECADGKKVVLLDFGVKENIIRSLTKRGCHVTVVPAFTPVEEIVKMKPDGIMLSNGPGDPADNPEIIKNISELNKHKIPTMGICLGHQLLALANGFETEKLKFGHRGANQPVKNLESGKVYISSQNHGYAVKSESIQKDVADELFVNVNDGSNEGLRYKKIPAFSVQFHPEACGGPKDTGFLFDEFVKML